MITAATFRCQHDDTLLPVSKQTIPLLWATGFLIGTTTHLVDVIRYGFLPYTMAPDWINVYWTSLTAFDPLVVLLLWKHRKAAVALGITIMVSDVTINSYVYFMLDSFESAMPLILQTLFLILVVSSAPMLVKPDTGHSKQL